MPHRSNNQSGLGFTYIFKSYLSVVSRIHVVLPALVNRLELSGFAIPTVGDPEAQPLAPVQVKV